MIWLIQNIKDDIEINKLLNIISNNNIEHKLINYIPFSEMIITDLKEDCLYFPYGSVVFIDKIINKYNKNIINYRSEYLNNYDNLLNKYGKLFLNNDFITITFEELLNLKNKKNTYFIKPKYKTKKFTGCLVDLEHIEYIYSNLSSNNYLFDTKLEIILSQEKVIDYEYRFFIIDKKIISGSRYFKYSKLNQSKIVNLNVLNFCRECIDIYNPCDMYVIDIGLYKNKYYVIELNDIHSSGFYSSDIEKIILNINNFLI